MSAPILSVHNPVGGYGKTTIPNGTSFAVPQATITTVIGANGAGVDKAKHILGDPRIGQLFLCGAMEET